jgi:hypothetical protein
MPSRLRGGCGSLSCRSRASGSTEAAEAGEARADTETGDRRATKYDTATDHAATLGVHGTSVGRDPIALGGYRYPHQRAEHESDDRRHDVKREGQ